jgi:hypothetical protein
MDGHSPVDIDGGLNFGGDSPKTKHVEHQQA